MRPVTDVHELFRRQRAIRTFTDEDVPDELVNRVLTAAIHGPSGSNTQPWPFIVIRDPRVKHALSEVYEEARAAARVPLPSAAGARQPLSAASRTDRGPRERSRFGSGGIVDGRLDLSECGEPHAGRPRPWPRDRAHDLAPPPQGSDPRHPWHPRPYRECRHHPARLARP